MQQVLLLNSSYEVLGTLSWEAAVTGLTTGKFQLIEEYDQVVRSAYLTMRIPAVVKTTEYISKPIKQVKFSRASVYARDKFKCGYCGEKCATDELTYDHVVPRSQGGQTNWTNITSCCYACNAKKGGRTPVQAKMKLLNKLVRPEAVPEFKFEFTGKQVPEQWRDYLYDVEYWDGELDVGE